MPAKKMPVSGIAIPYALGKQLDGLDQLQTARRQLKNKIDIEEDKPTMGKRNLAVLRLDLAIVILHIKRIDVRTVQNSDPLVESVDGRINLAEELKKLSGNPRRSGDDELRIAKIKREIEGDDEDFKEIYPGDLDGI